MQAMNVNAPNAAGASVLASLPDWLMPVPEQPPCGPNLEYEQEYVLLMARTMPRRDVQYGSFIEPVEAPNWAEVERDCRRLLLRSRDISILILFLRCRTRQAQAAGLLEGLTLLTSLLARHAEQLHPQLTVDGEFDPSLRANALAALCDPEGLLGDVRDIVIAAHSVQRLLVKDVERAHAVPRADDALPLTLVQRQLAHLRQSQDVSLFALRQAQRQLLQLQQLMRDNLKDAAPDLSSLLNLLQLLGDAAPCTSTSTSFATEPEDGGASADAVGIAVPPLAVKPEALMPAGGKATLAATDAVAPVARQAALLLIQQARLWFEENEPSSPVATLLRQAERLVGKRFAEVADCIPAALLQEWERQ